MSLDTDRIEALSFDSFSTLVDVGAAADALPAEVDNPDAVATEWRQRALVYSILCGYLDRYETYYQLHRDGLEYAAARHGLGLSEGELDNINEAYLELEPFEDVNDGFAALDDAGYDLYVLSNGDPAMLEGLLAATGIEPYLDGTISADEIQIFKPDERLYRHAADRAGVELERMAHVATPVFDVYGAMHAGAQGVWVNRGGEPRDPFAPAPDLTVETLTELVERVT